MQSSEMIEQQMALNQLNEMLTNVYAPRECDDEWLFFSCRKEKSIEYNRLRSVSQVKMCRHASESWRAAIANEVILFIGKQIDYTKC